MERDFTEPVDTGIYLDFNSHAHVERDVMPAWYVTQIRISTHTLTWSVTQAFHSELFALQFQLTRSRGAWRFQRGIRQRYRKFQLTRSRGAWHIVVMLSFWLIWFQLTRSRGAWHTHAKITQYHKDFNSHAHVERDYFSDVSDMLHKISTHTLTWSVTVCSEI